MGCSFSSVLTVVDDRNSLIPSRAMVVATDGSLLEYSAGILASEVIKAVGQVYALCNSDKLFFDAYPPAMALDDELVLGQIYFLLPVAELDRRLSSAHAAALAIRAGAAMKRAAEKEGKRRIRVAPVEEVPAVEVGSSGGDLEFRSQRSKRMLSTIEEDDED